MQESASSTTSDPEQRHVGHDRPTLGGIVVREEDVEPVKGIRAIAYLFRGMAVLLILLVIVQVMSGLSGTVPLSPGVLFAEAIRLVIFAGLLWGVGDLAVLGIKSHYDLRATRILVARVAYMMRKTGEANGTLPPNAGTRSDRGT